MFFGQPLVLWYHIDKHSKHLFAVLTELFEKADTTGDGKVSLEEFTAICTEYGVELSEEGKEELATAFGLSGAVSLYISEKY